MICGMPEIRTILLADSSVTDLVGTYYSKPAIYDIPLLPGKYAGDGITMYQSSGDNGGSEFGEWNITINSFTSDYQACITLREAAYTALNRKMEGSDTFFRCSRLPVILPATTGGSDYNAPLEVYVRQR